MRYVTFTNTLKIKTLNNFCRFVFFNNFVFMGKYKNLTKSRTPLLDQILHDKCISRGEAMAEMDAPRSFYYSTMTDDYCKVFVKAHENDWTFEPEKLQKAIDKSKIHKKELAEKLDIHFVHIYSFLSGKQRPTRKNQHYQKIEKFCKQWFCY